MKGSLTSVVILVGLVGLGAVALWYGLGRLFKAIPTPAEAVKETFLGAIPSIQDIGKATGLYDIGYDLAGAVYTEEYTANQAWNMLGESSKSFLIEAPWRDDPTMFADLPDGGAYARSFLEQERAKQTSIGNISGGSPADAGWVLGGDFEAKLREELARRGLL